MASRHNSKRSIRGGPPLAPSQRWSTAGQGGGKANYRPLTSMSRRPSRLQQRQSTLEGDIPEAEGDVAMETTQQENRQETRNPALPFPSPKRYSYRKPSDPKVASEMAVLIKYVKDKNLMNTMMTCCQSVLKQDSLPYNPYPDFVTSIRHDAERFHMFAKTARAIRAELTNKLQPTTTPHIYGVKGYSGAWGLEPLVNTVSTQALKQYDWLIEDAAPKQLVLSDEQKDYSGQILVAIVGPAIFTGTMYHEAPTVDLRLEYVIYGPDLQMAFSIFNSSISEDISQMNSPNSSHKILRIHVPKTQSSESKGEPQTDEFWTTVRVKDHWEDFWSAVRDAIEAKKPITLQCVFCLDKENSVYRAGNKQYVLHFVQTSEHSNKEKFMSFAELPYLTLYEGVFIQKAHAEAYVMMLKRHQETNSPQTGAQTSQQRQRMHDSLVSLQEVDEDDGNDLMNNDIVRDPIRRKWQKKISQLHPIRDAFHLAHLALLLALSDKSEESIEVEVELYRFLHSTAASWRSAKLLNSTIQMLAVTLNKESTEDQTFLSQHFQDYKKKLLAVLDPKLHARSSEFHVAHAVLGKLIQRMLMPDPADSTKYVLKSLNKLQLIQDYCTSLQLLMTEDAMFFFKKLNLKTLVRGCKEAFSKASVKVADPAKKKGQAVKPTKSNASVTSSQAQNSNTKVNHGMECKEIIQQRNIVIDVDEVKSFSNWPRIMVTEAVLMQYMIDIKLDLVWHEYLLELLNANQLAPNPYPRLSTVLCQAAHRLQLCSETNSTLSSKLLRPDQTKLVDRVNTIHGVAGVGAFGLSHRTLAGVDTDPRAFGRVVKLCSQLTNRNVPPRRGQFQISVSQALGQSSPFYGRLVPYLTTVHLYEHYYIRGGIGADVDAIQLYAKLVYDYIMSVSSKNHYIVLGVCFNDGGRFMSETDLETGKATFCSHIVDAARKKEDVYLKIYQLVGWRYLCLHKHFVLHYLFVDNTEDRHECYSPDDPSTVHQYVFLSSEEAAAHSRGSGIQLQGNLEGAARMKAVNNYLNKKIEGALEDHKVTKAYELILCKALVNKDTKLISDAWRVFHSLAFQLEYVQTINKDLQTLIWCAVTFPKKLVKAAPSSQSLAKGRSFKAKVEADLSGQGALSDTGLDRLMTIYSDKLLSILREPCAFVPTALIELIQDKLQTMIHVDQTTQRQSLLIAHRTVTTLKSIHQLVQPVHDWVSYDVHRAITGHGGSPGWTMSSLHYD